MCKRNVTRRRTMATYPGQEQLEEKEEKKVTIVSLGNGEMLFGLSPNIDLQRFAE